MRKLKYKKFINTTSTKRVIRQKRLLLILSCLCLSFVLFCPIGTTTQAAELTQDEIQQEITESIDDQLGKLDFSSIEEVINHLTKGQQGLFGSSSFVAKLRSIITGEFADGSTSIWGALVSLVFDNLLKYLPIISSVIAIAIFGSMLQGLRPSNGKSISNVIHFVTYGMIVVILLTVVVQMVQMTSGVITNIKSQMDAIFPILLTLLTAIGGTVSVSVYQPAMALLTGTILNIFTYVLLPIFIFSTIFAVVSNLSNSVKLDKFTSFFNSAYKWLTGLIFTIFSAFLSIQGIAAGSVDGISIRTAKYAIRSYVPILGSYLSDGLGIILASSNLIKNAVGAAGLILLLATIAAPLIELILFMLTLKFIAGIVEPLGNSQIANFVSGLAKSMTLLISLIIGVAFVYFIMLGLIMCSANII